jgi:hypothetical protein
MIGFLAPGEYNSYVEHAYRMHGESRYYMDPKWSYHAGQIPWRVGGDAFLQPAVIRTVGLSELSTRVLPYYEVAFGTLTT